MTAEQYNRTDVVSTYEAFSSFLMPAEAHLFGRHLDDGMDVLDVGVGAGRTTPALSRLGGRYVGLDYAQTMVEVCRQRFPHLEFRQGDAADLGMFDDDSFDAVVFSFNGIDCMLTDHARGRFLDEAARVLRPGGRLILSRHNAHALFIVPLRTERRGWRSLAGLTKYAFFENIRRVRTLATGEALRRGEGQILDPTDGGIQLMVATKERVIEEITKHGFVLREVVGSNHPWRLPSVATPWWYYAFSLPGPSPRR